MDQILLSPGLYWIGELIFIDFLDNDETFANCELVCKKWQQFFIQAELWRRRLFYKMAKPGTYRRSLLDGRPDLKNLTDGIVKVDSSTSLEDKHIFFRSLAFKFSKKARLLSWKNGK